MFRQQFLGLILAAMFVCLASCVPNPVDLPTAQPVRLEKAADTIDSGNLDGPKSPGLSSNLSARIDAILQRGLEQRQMDASVNAAWQIMHGVVCYGQELTIQTPDRGLVGAIDYAFTGGVIKGFELSRGDALEGGRRGVRAKLEAGSYVGQGHVDQWIAICAMAEIPGDTVVRIGDAEHNLIDWARQAALDVSDNYLDEYGWTLIALTCYLPETPEWTTRAGDKVSWEDLVDVEIKQDLTVAACGGTHGLAGVISAVAAKQRMGLPDSDVWTRAENLIQTCIETAERNRASDGRLSCYYFDRSGISSDLSVELSGAGHVFEFLALALPRESLQEPWVVRACERICELMEATHGIDLECGGLYHALHGLKVYRDRIGS